MKSNRKNWKVLLSLLLTVTMLFAISAPDATAWFSSGGSPGSSSPGGGSSGGGNSGGGNSGGGSSGGSNSGSDSSGSGSSGSDSSGSGSSGSDSSGSDSSGSGSSGSDSSGSDSSGSNSSGSDSSGGDSQTIENYTVIVKDSYAKQSGAGQYDAQDKVTVNAGSRSGYSFAGWTADGIKVAGAANATITFIMPENNVTLTATWKSRGGSGGGIGLTPTSQNTDIEDVQSPLTDIRNHSPFIKGYEDGTVRPDGSITRAEVAMILWRLLPAASTNSNNNSVFTDVETGAWYAQAVDCLYGLEVIKGYEDGTFLPNARISREEFTAMVCRAYNAKTIQSANNPFSDVFAGWAYDFIITAAGNNWVNGYSDGTFKPKSDITRAESVTIFNRILERKVLTKGIPEENYTLYSDLRIEHWAFQDILEASVTHTYTKDGAGNEIWQGVDYYSSDDGDDDDSESDDSIVDEE